MFKSQVAYEYFVIIAFFLSILYVYIVYLYSYSISLKEDKDSIIASDSLNKIGQTIDWIGFQGEPAKTILRIFIPENVINISVINKTIIWKIKTTSGISDIYYISKVNSEFNITKRGELNIVVEAVGNLVKVYVS